MADSAHHPGDAPRSPRPPAEARSISYRSFLHLVERAEGWDFDDLGDLLQEVRLDPGLNERERDRLLETVYHLIWRRAEPLLDR